MIKSIALILIIWNPVNDTESEMVYGTYTLEECLIKEYEINKEDSIINKKLKRNKLELNATLCE